MATTPFPYNRTEMLDRCKRTHALLEGVSIAKLCRTWKFEQVIGEALTNLPTVASDAGWTPAQIDCMTRRLTVLRTALLDANPNITFYDLLTTNSSTWGGNILSASCELQHDILLAYLYVPDRRGQRLPEIKDEIKDLFNVHNLLNHIGNNAKTLRYYHERDRTQDSAHEILLIKVARRLGIFEPFQNAAHGTRDHEPSCGTVVNPCFGPVTTSEGGNGMCHYYDSGLSKWRCRNEPHYNCDINAGQPTSFSDPCPPPP